VIEPNGGSSLGMDECVWVVQSESDWMSTWQARHKQRVKREFHRVQHSVIAFISACLCESTKNVFHNSLRCIFTGCSAAFILRAYVFT